MKTFPSVWSRTNRLMSATPARKRSGTGIPSRWAKPERATSGSERASFACTVITTRAASTLHATAPNATPWTARDTGRSRVDRTTAPTVAEKARGHTPARWFEPGRGNMPSSAAAPKHTNSATRARLFLRARTNAQIEKATITIGSITTTACRMVSARSPSPNAVTRTSNWVPTIVKYDEPTRR